MARVGNIITASDRHSIKEASFTFFVSPHIANPEEFSTLLNEGHPLADTYHKFEPIKMINIKFKPGINGPEMKETAVKGFKLVRFSNGRTQRIIQGINEPKRDILTFNTLEYTEWSDFLTTMQHDAEIVSKFRDSLNVLAYSLLYVDEFSYDDAKLFEPQEVFNPDSMMLPKDVAKCRILNYNLNTQKQKENREYLENLSVKVLDDRGRKVVQITDNITFVIDSAPQAFRTLIHSNRFIEDLNFAHSENKDLLKDVLNKTIISEIGL